MGVIRRKVPTHYIPIHPDNVAKKDWIILLEAGTIVGDGAEKLRVALATMDRKIIKKYDVLLRARHFLVLPGYDPRIHALYFCPQLYTYDADNVLISLEGVEIGKLVAQSVQDAVVEKQPWYEPSRTLPSNSIIGASMKMDFDTVVVGTPSDRRSSFRAADQTDIADRAA